MASSIARRVIEQRSLPSRKPRPVVVNGPSATPSLWDCASYAPGFARQDVCRLVRPSVQWVRRFPSGGGISKYLEAAVRLLEMRQVAALFEYDQFGAGYQAVEEGCVLRPRLIVATAQEQGRYRQLVEAGADVVVLARASDRELVRAKTSARRSFG